jgi:hypothetical protein
MKQSYDLILKRFKYKIPFTKLKISCGYTIYTNIIDKGTLVDSLIEEGFEDGQQFKLIPIKKGKLK